MVAPQTGAQMQPCPSCSTPVDTSGKEPLSEINCPKCGAKLCVECSFDNYVLLELLGTGGMGSVYKAKDTRLNRSVALKLLRKELAAETDAAEKLQQEARTTASINHPNVVKVYSSGTAHGQFYIVMELVDKWSFDELMEVQKRVPEAQTLDVGIQVARGLQAAQRVGLIHRDIKPGNILFSDATTAKIVDFGLAIIAEQKAESTGEIWGTPYYVAPERLDNANEDFRSDVYSLGATLFHAVSGKPPFEGDTDSAIALRDLKKNALRLSAVAPDVSAGTVAAIERMMEIDPKDRYDSYRELIDDLERSQKALAVRASGGAAKPKGSGGGKWLFVAAAILVVALVAGGAFWWFRNHRPRGATVQAQQNAAGGVVTLQPQFDEARQQLISGQYRPARAAFFGLTTKAGGQQPLLNWSRMHVGLAALLEGEPSTARRAFQEVVQSGTTGFAAADTGLAQWFNATAAALTREAPISDAETKEYDGTASTGFSLFAFGVHDWELGAFKEAVALFERFQRAEPSPQHRWIADYKPLARAYTDDYSSYVRWVEERKAATTTEQLVRALEAIPKLKNGGALAKQLKTEEQQLSREVAEHRAADETHATEQRQLTEKETPAWNAALAAYKKNVAGYRFPEALMAVKSARVTSDTLKEQQNVAARKAQWLIDWKTRLTESLNRSAYGATITDLRGTPYTGAVGATPTRLKLRNPYGTVEVDWALVPPATLLSMSKSFVRPNAADAADRQWLCAIFALETGQPGPAAELARAAAAAKADYQQQLATFFPTQ